MNENCVSSKPQNTVLVQELGEMRALVEEINSVANSIRLKLFCEGQVDKADKRDVNCVFTDLVDIKEGLVAALSTVQRINERIG